MVYGNVIPLSGLDLECRDVLLSTVHLAHIIYALEGYY